MRVTAVAWSNRSSRVSLPETLFTNNTSDLQLSPSPPSHSGVPFGHTGHVRFITYVDYTKIQKAAAANAPHTEPPPAEPSPSRKKPSATDKTGPNGKADDSPVYLVISGGDGYEDFRNAGVTPLSDVAGREDSTNHLLLWQV